ncbi:MAG: V4R domain-containing protein [Candidatus Aenigmatarchaeota archaeon]
MLSIFFRKLLLARQASIDEGEIRILTKNFYMQPMYELIILQEKIKKEFGKKGLRLIYEAGKIGFNDLVRYIEKFTSKKEEVQNLWLNVLKVCGIGNLEIIEIDKEKPKAILQTNKNPFAREYLKEYGKQKECVDYLTAGIIAGFFSRFFEKEVECEEKSCIARGNVYCSFVVKKA